MNWDRPTTAKVILLVAFVIRLGGVALTTVTDLNPDSQADATRFAEMAASIASGETSLETVWSNFGTTDPTWGLFLAPFWLLPGPSIVYARIGSAFLGAVAVYNVFLIARHYHSRSAGLFAVAPIMLFPSFVAMHSTIMREAIILFGLTTAVRLIIVPGRWHLIVRYGLATGLILLAILFRFDNAPVYAAMFGVGLCVYLVRWRREFIVPIFASIPITYYVYTNHLLDFLSTHVYHRRESLVEFLIFFRGARIREGGRTQYLTEMRPETISELISFAPIGAVYFIYVPFPWMVETFHDAIISVEGIIAIVYSVFAVLGVGYMARKNLPATAGLLAGFFIFVGLYGIISTNVGTAMRQRQVLYWVLPLFGGIGLAERFETRLDTMIERVRYEYDTRVAPLYADRVPSDDSAPSSSDTTETESDEFDLSEYKRFPRNDKK